MKFSIAWILSASLFPFVSSFTQENSPAKTETQAGDSWTKVLKDRSKRGTLHDAFQKVRGDSGKWNDEPRLQHAPPIELKPPKVSLDDWADLLEKKKRRPPSSDEDNWLIFKTRQLDDNDRVWIERIERKGNQFTVVLNEAIWQGRYLKTFTFYNVYGVNLGKLSAGKYTAKWVVKPMEFRAFEGNGRPTDQRVENWPKEEHLSDKKPKELTVTFTVVE